MKRELKKHYRHLKKAAYEVWDILFFRFTGCVLRWSWFYFTKWVAQTWERFRKWLNKSKAVKKIVILTLIVNGFVLGRLGHEFYAEALIPAHETYNHVIEGKLVIENPVPVVEEKHEIQIIEKAEATEKPEVKEVPKTKTGLSPELTSFVETVITESQKGRTVEEKAKIRTNAYIVAEMGAEKYGEGETYALLKLVTKESHFKNWAKNPSSSAYGMYQFLDSTWKGYGAKTSDPVKQTQYGLAYVKNRYSTPGNALYFHQLNGWY